MSGTGSQNVLYDVEWQVLRVSLLKDNNALGGWTTVEGTVDNLNKLDAYFKSADVHSSESALRAWRVLNALNAVRMGYSGQQLTGESQDCAVRYYRDSIRTHTSRFEVAKANKHWDWNKVEVELKELSHTPQVVGDRYYIWFNILYFDLSRRRKHAEKKHELHATRPALLRFLDLMEKVDPFI